MKVERVQIQNLRGIGGPLTIELEPNGATLIYGDNGSGKSSICDAIEFGLRGAISRRLTDGHKERREVRNLAAVGVPSVEIGMQDNSHWLRGHKRPSWTTASAVQYVRSEVVAGFERSPLVLRRRVVEAFWEVSPRDRLDLFWDYMKEPGTEWRTSKDDALLEAYDDAKAKFAMARTELLKIAPLTTKLPGTQSRWAPPTHTSVLPVVSRAVQAANVTSGQRRRVSIDQQAIIDHYAAALTAEEALRPLAGTAASRRPRDPAHLSAMLLAAGQRACDDYREIMQTDWLQDIIVTATDDALDVQLLRHDSEPVAPTAILSEAQLDLLALFVLIEMHVECAGNEGARLLILDDVFQSVDSPVRRRALDHLASRLKSWQLVITIHDRLWLEIASRTFTDANQARRVIELRDGGYGRTPRVLGGRLGPLRDLDGAIDSGLSGPTVAGIAGRAFEHLADELSKSLRVLVRRKDRDEYTIGDLWPAVSRELKDTPYWDGDLAKLEQAQFLRNKLGSHYAEWGDSISDAECLEAASLVRAAWHALSCRECGVVVTRNNGTITAGCSHPSADGCEG